jgi:hypothetical protein
MTTSQRNMLFAEWKKCWIAIVRASGGQTTADEREVRMALTLRATGRAIVSWSDLTRQKDIDRLLLRIWAIAQSGNFDLQLRQQDQVWTRAQHSVLAQSLLDALGIEQRGREAYLDAIAKRIHKKPLPAIDDEEWTDVLAALNHSRLHRLGVAHSHPKVNTRPTFRAGQKAASQAPAAGPERTGSIVAQGENEPDF